jgi:hypothetical protein
MAASSVSAGREDGGAAFRDAAGGLNTQNTCDLLEHPQYSDFLAAREVDPSLAAAILESIRADIARQLPSEPLSPFVSRLCHAGHFTLQEARQVEKQSPFVRDLCEQRGYRFTLGQALEVEKQNPRVRHLCQWSLNLQQGLEVDQKLVSVTPPPPSSGQS